MSDTTPAPGSRLTVEDAGSTTDPADLVDGDGTTGSATGTSGTTVPAGGAHAVDPEDRPGSASTRTASTTADASGSDTTSTAADDDLPSAPGATTSGLSSLIADDDGSIGHVFDQTNGVVDRLDGDSDGTAESDELSAAERADEDPAFDAFADTETQRAGDTDDPRVTGN